MLEKETVLFELSMVASMVRVYYRHRHQYQIDVSHCKHICTSTTSNASDAALTVIVNTPAKLAAFNVPISCVPVKVKLSGPLTFTVDDAAVRSL